MVKDIVRAVMPPRVWTALRMARLRWAIASYRPRDVVHSYGGVRLKVHLGDALAAGWYDHDWDELAEIALLRRGKLKPGTVVFDIGAHQGVVALQLAAEVTEAGRVLAIEANPHNARVARRNCEMNAAAQVAVVNAAISDQPGTLVMNQSLNGQADDGSGAWGQVTVEAVTVDGLARRYGRPDVLFIDVEGFECHALRGARDTLATRPDCFVEVHVGAGLEKFGGSVHDVVAAFPADKYEVLMASEIHPVFVPFDPGSPTTRDRFFLVALSRA